MRLEQCVRKIIKLARYDPPFGHGRQQVTEEALSAALLHLTALHSSKLPDEILISSDGGLELINEEAGGRRTWIITPDGKQNHVWVSKPFEESQTHE